MSLTDLKIRKLKPQSKEYTVSDSNGLSLRVRPNGTKNFQYQYMVNGQRGRVNYGIYPAKTLIDARSDHSSTKAKIKNEKIAPKSKIKDKLDKDPTIKEFAETFYEDYLMINSRNKKCADESNDLLNRNFVNHLGSHKLKTISRSTIVDILKNVASRGPITANRSLSIIKVVFNYAIDLGIIEFSVVAGIRKKSIGGVEVSRDRHLSINEIGIFLRTIDQSKLPLQVKLVLKILLYTGKRVSEVLSIKLDELDLENRIWKLPKERTKIFKKDEIYLTDSLLIFIDELMSLNNGSKWLVPALKNNNQHMEHRFVSRSLKANLGFFGFKKPFVTHDLRRSLSTGMNDIAIFPHVVEFILAHAIKGSEKTYNLSKKWDEKVDAWLKWESKLLTLIKCPLIPMNYESLKLQ